MRSLFLQWSSKAAAAGLLLLTACGQPQDDTAAGPATAAAQGPVKTGLGASPPGGGAVSPDGPADIAVPAALDGGDAARGEALFASKGCKACHNVDQTRLVGPGLQGVAARRSPAWLARMILEPEAMLRSDPEAKKLFATYMTPMANQHVDPAAELPHLLAFLQSKN